MTHKTVPIEPKKVEQGSDFHFSLLMATYGLNFVTGQDRKDLLAWGRDIWNAALEHKAAPPDNTVQELRGQLNEADRRAGAAERQMQSYVSECQSSKDWIRKAKEEWGVDNSVSFDVVWKEALQLRGQVENLKIALVEWFAKTEWVQATLAPKELGYHLADVLRNRIEELQAKCDAQQVFCAEHEAEVAELEKALALNKERLAYLNENGAAIMCRDDRRKCLIEYSYTDLGTEVDKLIAKHKEKKL